ncbi:MAG: hypothetical protein Q9163_005554 [Psora crenata]
MSQEGQTLAPLEPLPQCEGPKLHPFPPGNDSIDFIRVLGYDQNPNDLEEMNEPGIHSNVFEVCIRSKRYALKIFKFYNGAQNEYNSLLNRDKKRVSFDTVRTHNDPFYNECRAHGRLIEKGVEGKIAVRCYGYITIPAEKEIDLWRKFSIRDWDRTEEESRQPIAQRRPLRAIVKELLSNNAPYTPKVVHKMLRDLRKMRRLGVYAMDIAPRNYIAGLLVDFSIAMTKPHYWLEVTSKHTVHFWLGMDLHRLDEMIEEKKVKTWQRATRNPVYTQKLRAYVKFMRRDNAHRLKDYFQSL